MIEVMVATMLVALIAIGTLSGFDAAGRASADERAHALATVLAQQDEERLRSMTTAELGQMGTSSRVVKEGATEFTIKSSARYVAAEKETFTCETTTSPSADYIQTTSSVTWPALGTRPAVTQSSFVSAPTAGELEVKVVNQKGEPLEGASVTGTGLPTQTTPSTGCVIYGGLTAGSYTVDASKGAYADQQGKSPPPSKTVSVSLTALATAEFKIGPPGTITAEFESNGSTVGVTSDTFVALNTGIQSPDFFLGGTPSTYASSATQSGLFPFTSKYVAYAGDCEKNNPELVTGGTVKPREAQVEPNLTTTVKVEVPVVNITVYEGTSASKGALVTSATSAKMFNPECKETNSQDFEPVKYEHSLSLESGGHIVPKYQPYAKALEFCVVALKSGTYYKYRTPSTSTFANSAKAGTASMFVYLKETTSGYSKSTSVLTC